jgi:hypothetical protein
VCDEVIRLAVEKGARKEECDPLLWELLLVWRARAMEFAYLTRGRLAAANAPREDDGAGEEGW